MSVQGYLKIKTKIDNKDIDKGVTELEDKIKKLQTDNARQSNAENDLRAEIRNYEELTRQADKYNQKIKEIKGMSSIRAPQLQELIETQRLYNDTCSAIDKQANKINKVYSKLEQVKSKQEENNRKIEEYRQKIEQINLNKIQSSLDNVGKGLQKQIKNLGKMTLAVFGVRTAYNAVRSAVSTLSQYNPQIATDIEYIRYALASMLLPVVQKLISLAYTLLSYINAIASAWFGINLFASAKAFQSMKASAGSTAKSAKEIQKSLQGFDEMNVLQDNSSSAGGSGGGISTPSMDLSELQGEVPGWLQFILDNKDLILSTLAGIAGGLVAIKLGASVLQALGIGAMITGILWAIQALKDYLEEPTWENFGKIIQGIGIFLAGLLGIILGFPGVVIGVVVLIVGTIIKYWEQIKAFLQGGIDWLVGKSDWVHEIFGDTIGNIYDTFINILQDMLNAVDDIFKGIREIFDGFIDFFAGIFTGDWSRVLEGLGKIFEGLINTLAGLFRLTWSALLNVLGSLGGWIYQNVIQPIGNFFRNMWDGIKQGAQDAWDGITGIFSRIGNWFRNVINNTIENFRYMGQRAGEVISGAFKAVVNGVLRTIENILNSPIRAINSLIGAINAIPGINISKLRTFNLPRLAKGGIISQPTTAIIGEAGKEVVMPLENNTEWIDMLADRLASKIGNNGGSYIIQMDGRTIDRGIAKRKQELAFVTNGR